MGSCCSVTDGSKRREKKKIAVTVITAGRKPPPKLHPLSENPLYLRRKSAPENNASHIFDSGDLSAHSTDSAPSRTHTASSIHSREKTSSTSQRGLPSLTIEKRTFDGAAVRPVPSDRHLVESKSMGHLKSSSSGSLAVDLRKTQVLSVRAS
eukprot:GILK01003162.1.p1 GENE.GILK01003162.1~~GILK01003162.1.p1  ORF type:complete len:152 (+),score=8.73 GILK01003162.1:108-563(+)